MSGRPRLALTLGDPAGIGPEIVLRALASEACPAAEWVVYGPLGSIAERARRFGLGTRPPQLVLLPEPRFALMLSPLLESPHSTNGLIVGFLICPYLLLEARQ